MSQTETFRYGKDAVLTIEFRDETHVECGGQPQGAGFDDTMAAVMASLVAPLDYPALADATVSGDNVAIAVGGAVPELGLVLDGILRTLVDSGVSPANISVLLAGAAITQPASLDINSWRDPVDVSCHDPRDRMSLAYLASTESGHAVYMNRKICDADLVVTVGCMRPGPARGYFGVHGNVYPAFADIDTLRRFQSRQAPDPGGTLNDAYHLLSREVDEAGWLLGARFTIQVIPGGGGEILHVLSGDVDVVNAEGARRSRQAWSCPVTQKANLVIAALQGGASQQTWQNLYRSIEAASRIVDEDGAIVLCTELDCPLDEMALRSIADSSGECATGSLRPASGQLETEDARQEPSVVPEVPSLDAVQPHRIVPSLQDVSIYLLSALSEQLVEDLGMVPINKPAEIVNLCRHHDRCVVLSNAQHAWPELDDHAVSSV